ncbi:hypothetical protein C2E19_10070 [Pseudomonas sp. DTU12.3]|uniref:hypothetical protein n=1 Tax=Pseudomonas sp. DTU12.3 TaxID=2073078 RepID=UPI001011DABD|nr:hypothetical protein [Pseudomonas sp. DTU12.3]QAX84187.1 hypothetical protein C2E19_10070 [Pseudomonas sp. DTU12.3]
MKSPFENVELSWEPRLSYILASLEIYDREEEGEVLRHYDPNRPEGRKQIIEKIVLPDLAYLSYRHRFALIEVLKKALDDRGFDFRPQFSSDYDEYITMAWSPDEIDDPRLFFEEIYRLASEAWRDDLYKASLEDQSTW